MDSNNELDSSKPEKDSTYISTATIELETVKSDRNDLDDAVDGINAETIINLYESEDGNSSETVKRLSFYELAGKKTAAQGLMDVALLTANANQLRYILEFNQGSSTFNVTFTLIVISLALQVFVGMFLIFRGRYYVKGQSKSANAKRVKNYLLFGVFLITVINIFIASFTTMDA